jgi:hypothetical protein
MAFKAIGLPHSEILGSQIAQHLTEAFRSYATSFIGSWCQGIHYTPLFGDDTSNFNIRLPNYIFLKYISKRNLLF